ncbi:hypothetical protein OPV22_029023 [Ensete ventricosum]|uniref:Uncharacterized protein n=1 Tax=Ensete ventricosum TaxID=4639 RepID=A0AAV8P5M9_ENSVE|nr:hypothetical protein OPV22_029023 [Ensete ventricosum]
MDMTTDMPDDFKHQIPKLYYNGMIRSLTVNNKKLPDFFGPHITEVLQREIRKRSFLQIYSTFPHYRNGVFYPANRTIILTETLNLLGTYNSKLKTTLNEDVNIYKLYEPQYEFAGDIILLAETSTTKLYSEESYTSESDPGNIQMEEDHPVSISFRYSNFGLNSTGVISNPSSYN